MSSSFSPSPAELAFVSQIFTQADPNKLGVVTGDAAIKIFAGTKLPPVVLGEIWAIADEDNKGWLSKRGVAIAVRLIGWAQKGEKVAQDLLNKNPGPLPTIEGISVLTQQVTGTSIPGSPPPGLPPLTLQDKAKFQRLFAGAGPINGLLSGEKARDLFVKSKLHVEKLSQIWVLADTQDRGALDSTDFAIGMYLIQASMSGQLSLIPNSLPPGLYEQAGGIQQATVLAQSTGTSGSMSPSFTGAFQQHRSNIKPQYTGQSQTHQSAAAPLRHPSHPASSAFGNAPFSSPPGKGHSPPWDVTVAEKASSDRFFDGLDTDRKGYIEGKVAVPFMLNSNLLSDDLAQIWDLADINSDGRLTREGFAIAMHLIKNKLAGKDIPASLPPDLVPPSMRTNGISAFPPQHSSEPQGDLFTWDDTPPVSATAASTVQSQATGMQSSTFISSISQPPTLHDPFSKSNITNLLDNDDGGTSSPPLQDKSAEIGNVQNQLSSTIRSSETAKTERASLEETLANQAAQLSSLQTQLSSAKAAYETETKLLDTVRERLTGQTAEIHKAREELIRAESDLSAVRIEKAEIEGSFLRDKEEARDLHRKMVEVGQYVEATKLEVEKVKKEAKQQKGLLAIARKQLNMKEAEKSKVAKEIEEANHELLATVTAKEETEAMLGKLSSPVEPNASELVNSPGADLSTIATASVLPTPTPSSPSGDSASVSKSNNPFERLAMASGKSSPRSQSPFLPFANSNPTPPTHVPATGTEKGTVHDPFGFSQMFETEEFATIGQQVQNSVGLSDPGLSTPKPASANLSLSLAKNPSPSTPTTDASDNEYATPPTTSRGLTPAMIVSNAAAMFPDLNEAASHFPALDVDEPHNLLKSESQKGHHEETELGSKLTELDEDDSDSNSEDEIPLGDLAKMKNGADGTPTTGATLEPAAATVFHDIFAQPTALSTGTPSHDNQSSVPEVVEDIFGLTTTLNLPPALSYSNESVPKSTAPAPALASVNAFDETRGELSGNGNENISKSTAPAATHAGVNVFDEAMEEISANANGSAPKTTAPAPVVAGVNAFDEAMGKISGNGPTSALPQLSFDSTFESGFEDNFDFASAAEIKFPPPLATANDDGSSTLPTTRTQDGFDDIFKVPVNDKPAPTVPAIDGSAAVTTITSNGQPPAAPTVLQPSNDVGVLNETPSGSSAVRSSSLPSESLKAKSQSVTSPPASPESSATTSRVNAIPPASSPPPPRQKSPPPRASPPKKRPSTSSSKEAPHDKAKDPPQQRHSKLSLRLPFRKKKHQDSVPPPIPPVPQEEPAVVASPGVVDDDVDAVKLLCGMGFSRAQAVSALEKQSYDLQKALNSLLSSEGQQ